MAKKGEKKDGAINLIFRLLGVEDAGKSVKSLYTAMSQLGRAGAAQTAGKSGLSAAVLGARGIGGGYLGTLGGSFVGGGGLSEAAFGAQSMATALGVSAGHLSGMLPAIQNITRGLKVAEDLRGVATTYSLATGQEMPQEELAKYAWFHERQRRAEELGEKSSNEYGAGKAAGAAADWGFGVNQSVNNFWTDVWGRIFGLDQDKMEMYKRTRGNR